ncbi:hypothetical protein PIB30_069546 [Stylosanthes scabra]|uniref:Uncharacterized protein n=1 Tax=Stylosanthes scabra TaxID=79078 RepID=A0ABU6ZLV0_9FABA|nr:hypothetical protein [Stylosanthes scabra]
MPKARAITPAVMENIRHPPVQPFNPQQHYHHEQPADGYGWGQLQEDMANMSKNHTEFYDSMLAQQAAYGLRLQEMETRQEEMWQFQQEAWQAQHQFQQEQSNQNLVPMIPTKILQQSEIISRQEDHCFTGCKKQVEQGQVNLGSRLSHVTTWSNVQNNNCPYQPPFQRQQQPFQQPPPPIPPQQKPSSSTPPSSIEAALEKLAQSTTSFVQNTQSFMNETRSRLGMAKHPPAPRIHA